MSDLFFKVDEKRPKELRAVMAPEENQEEEDWADKLL